MVYWKNSTKSVTVCSSSKASYASIILLWNVTEQGRKCEGGQLLKIFLFVSDSYTFSLQLVLYDGA